MSDFDVSGLNELVADMAAAPLRVKLQIDKVVQRGAGNVVRDAQRFISGLRHAPLYPSSIGFDTEWKGATFEAEIGPDKDRPQGALGNLLEYGSSNNAPFAHLGPALDLEGPRFEQAIEGVADL